MIYIILFKINIMGLTAIVYFLYNIYVINICIKKLPRLVKLCGTNHELLISNQLNI